METTNSERRRSVKEILEGQDLADVLKASGKTDKEVSDILAPMIEDLSKEAFYVSVKAGEALGQSLNLASRKKTERTLNARYGSAVLSIVLALKSAGHQIVNMMDVPRGALIEARMPKDMFSLGGTVMFDVLDMGQGRTVIEGSSEVKGQMFDWGKGSRILKDVLDRTEQYLRRLEV